jgi:glycosyltransferase involved in cell wall biosynthesis
MVRSRLPSPAIAFDVTPLQNAHRYRGIGTYVRGLATRLAAQQDVPLEFWGWSGEEPFMPAPPHTSLWLPRFRMPQYRGAWLFAQLAMRRRARQSEVRAVHVTDPDALTNLRGREMLTTVYDLIPLREGISPRRTFAWLGYRSYLGSLRRTDRLFAISQQTADDVKGLLAVPESRVVLARPGIDLPAAEVEAPPRSRPYFLFIGGPNPNKNLEVLLNAMAICPELEQELLITGHWLPDQRAALEARLQSQHLAGRVHHLGFVDTKQLPGLMRSATALVIPSRLEGFGLPVGEGLAAGAAVIHSNIPVMNEISQGAALTFDPTSADDLARVMRRVARDGQLRDQLRVQGLDRARKLTWDEAVETTLKTYESVLAR